MSPPTSNRNKFHANSKHCLKNKRNSPPDYERNVVCMQENLFRLPVINSKTSFAGESPAVRGREKPNDQSRSPGITGSDSSKFSSTVSLITQSISLEQQSHFLGVRRMLQTSREIKLLKNNCYENILYFCYFRMSSIQFASPNTSVMYRCCASLKSRRWS